MAWDNPDVAATCFSTVTLWVSKHAKPGPSVLTQVTSSALVGVAPASLAVLYTLPGTMASVMMIASGGSTTGPSLLKANAPTLVLAWGAIQVVKAGGWVLPAAGVNTILAAMT